MPRKDRDPSMGVPWRDCLQRGRGEKRQLHQKMRPATQMAPGAAFHGLARFSSSIISSSPMLGLPASAIASSRRSAAMADRACPRLVARARAAALRRP